MRDELLVFLVLFLAGWRGRDLPSRRLVRHASAVTLRASMATLTMGIDLAAQPTNTAVCLLAWGDDEAPEVISLRRGSSEAGTRFDDKFLSTTASGLQNEHGMEVTKVGIDDPFGWPVPFLDALAAYRKSPAWPSGIDEPRDEFRLRETDRIVHARSGKWPLSVSADRIAIPAMRCAVILTDIARHRGAKAVARDGSGLCCEVYPDPALRFWTDGSNGCLGGGSYKGNDFSERRVRALDGLRDALPLNDPNDLLAQVALQDDFLDALVCALIARAVELGQTHPPDDNAQSSLAAIEGWIHLPNGPLRDLIVGKRRPQG